MAVLERFDDREVAVFLRDEVPAAFEGDSQIIGMAVLDAFGDNEILARPQLEERLADEGELFRAAALSVLDEYHGSQNR